MNNTQAKRDIISFSQKNDKISVLNFQPEKPR